MKSWGENLRKLQSRMMYFDTNPLCIPSYTSLHRLSVYGEWDEEKKRVKMTNVAGGASYGVPSDTSGDEPDIPLKPEKELASDEDSSDFPRIYTKPRRRHIKRVKKQQRPREERPREEEEEVPNLNDYDSEMVWQAVETQRRSLENVSPLILKLEMLLSGFTFHRDTSIQEITVLPKPKERLPTSDIEFAQFLQILPYLDFSSEAEKCVEPFNSDPDCYDSRFLRQFKEALTGFSFAAF
jgi:hypothetical protein